MKSSTSCCAATVWAVTLASCTARYVAPEPAAPHATLLLRVRYHGAHEGIFSESITLNDRELAMPRPTTEHATDAARLVRLRPEAIVIKVATDFRRYDVGVATDPQSASGMSCTANPIEASSCSGSGAQNTHHVLEAVPLATCAATLTVSPRADDELRVDYDFFGNAHCSATCVRVVRRPDGTVADESCP